MKIFSQSKLQRNFQAAPFYLIFNGEKKPSIFGLKVSFNSAQIVQMHIENIQACVLKHFVVCHCKCWCVRVGVCECVCVCERARERERVWPFDIVMHGEAGVASNSKSCKDHKKDRKKFLSMFWQKLLFTFGLWTCHYLEKERKIWAHIEPKKGFSY